MRSMCPQDDSGDCPYGNEVGTCFGFCMRTIVREQKGWKYENQETEEVENE